MWLNRKKRCELDVFRQEVLSDPALEQRFVGCTSQADAVDLTLALAQQRGYRFSRIEIERALALTPLQQMSDAELAQVGGGSQTCSGVVSCGAAAASADQLHQQSRRRRMLLKD